MTGHHTDLANRLELIRAETSPAWQDVRVVLRSPLQTTKGQVKRLLTTLGLRVRKINASSLPTRKRDVTAGPQKKMAKRVSIRMSGSSFHKPWTVGGKGNDDNIL